MIIVHMDRGMVRAIYTTSPEDAIVVNGEHTDYFIPEGIENLPDDALQLLREHTPDWSDWLGEA